MALSISYPNFLQKKGSLVTKAEWDAYLIPLVEKEYESYCTSSIITKVRNAFIHNQGYSILTKGCVQELASLLAKRRTLEVCCGTGYLSWYLKQQDPNLNIRTNDLLPEPLTDNQTSRLYAPISIVGDAVKTINKDQPQVVLVGWPPRPKVGSKSLLYEIANALPNGSILVTLLDSRIIDTSSFQKLVLSEFDVSTYIAGNLNRAHVNFPGMEDKWWVGIKKDIEC